MEVFLLGPLTRCRAPNSALVHHLSVESYLRNSPIFPSSSRAPATVLCALWRKVTSRCHCSLYSNRTLGSLDVPSAEVFVPPAVHRQNAGGVRPPCASTAANCAARFPGYLPTLGNQCKIKHATALGVEGHSCQKAWATAPVFQMASLFSTSRRIYTFDDDRDVEHTENGGTPQRPSDQPPLPYFVDKEPPVAFPASASFHDSHSSRLSLFYDYVAKKHSHAPPPLCPSAPRFVQPLPPPPPSPPAYNTFHDWTVRYAPFFWRDVWEFCGVCNPSNAGSPLLEIRGDNLSPGEQSINRFYAQHATSQGLPRTQFLFGAPSMRGLSCQAFVNTVFFPKGKLNFAENVVRGAGRLDRDVALVYSCEGSPSRTMTFGDLRRQVAVMMQFFRRIGLQKGDRVAAVVCNTPETVVTMLAVTGLGGIWSSCSPDFSLPVLHSRFDDLSPRLLVTSDVYRLKGRTTSCIRKAEDLCRRMASVKTLLTLPLDGAMEITFHEDIVSRVPDVFQARYSDIMNTSAATELAFPALSFNDPLFILFSSGTTGPPKRLVHRQGLLLQLVKEHQLHLDVRPGDAMLYYSTASWMMWNWLVAGLASGATLLLYEGHAMHPDPLVLWRFFDEHGGTLFGTSAKYLQDLEKMEIVPKSTFSLSRLRTLCSTGSPLYPHSFRYAAECIKRDLHLVSMSGGSDICSCFLTGNPTGEVREGLLQVEGLGMDVAVVNPFGESTVGRTGELACLQPFVSQPIQLWDDENRAKYIQTYFDKAKGGMWVQGDHCLSFGSPIKGFVILGRSDATLNPSGVRVSSSEIYQVVLGHRGVRECIAVGRIHNDAEHIVLFIVLAGTHRYTASFVAELKKMIRETLTSFHVPKHIFMVGEIPKTKNGKLMEKELKNFVNGLPATNLASAQNPDVFREYERFVHKPRLHPRTPSPHAWRSEYEEEHGFPPPTDSMDY
uniref:Acetoacetyl-CoA synthetase, putative n=1 Tax=Neospora caninum (strain Liverpool) TaxID=572307 RepID=A0A0F7UKF5_NEOCL|nr:TPA: acetoacetyl-CoA synthetase, putative [Neospora caninum Liverpool]